ncbi:MAG: Crp/Fnr family transcriptional regulator [Nevskia sp.]|nr:Crp/Fnr family transcriptional regulator [Nevskia sp.]
MSVATSGLVVNRLLASLPPQSRQRMLKRCEPVELSLGGVLCEAGEPIRYVYFPVRSYISMTAALENTASLEVRLIGNEGMLGVSLALGINTSPLRALVQGAGSALRMPAASFRSELEHSAVLRRGLGRYIYVMLAQLAQTAACACFHVVEARLARCLLMTQDRAHANHFYVTHALLAQMLGVRRSGITDAAGALQRKKLIRYSRGDITVLDRRGLEKASCECYGAATACYQRFLG